MSTGRSVKILYVFLFKLVAVSVKLRRVVAFAAFFFIATPVCAEWERLSADTIRFDGYIEKKSYDEYMMLAASGYSRIEISSGGGTPLVALKIAEDIASRNVTVVIDGLCFSACANYLALAGKHLIVNEGALLGWHGTLSEANVVVSEMRSRNLPKALIEVYGKWLSEFKKKEKKFYQKMGIDIRILQDSVDIVREDKVEPEMVFVFDEITGDYTTTRTAALWIPTPDVLQTYGININGFRWMYSKSDISSALEKHDVTVAFTSRGR